MSKIWQPATEEPEGEILIMTIGGGFKTGWYEHGLYWYDDKYHLPEQVAMWAKIEDIQEATKWLECLESYGLMK